MRELRVQQCETYKVVLNSTTGRCMANTKVPSLWTSSSWNISRQRVWHVFCYCRCVSPVCTNFQFSPRRLYWVEDPINSSSKLRRLLSYCTEPRAHPSEHGTPLIGVDGTRRAAGLCAYGGQRDRRRSDRPHAANGAHKIVRKTERRQQQRNRDLHDSVSPTKPNGQPLHLCGVRFILT